MPTAVFMRPLVVCAPINDEEFDLVDVGPGWYLHDQTSQYLDALYAQFHACKVLGQTVTRAVVSAGIADRMLGREPVTLNQNEMTQFMTCGSEREGMEVWVGEALEPFTAYIE